MKKGYNAAEVYGNYTKIEYIEELELTDDQKEEVKKKINEIKIDNYEDSYKRGEALEQLIRYIVESSGIFKCTLNKHTSSNEFDLLVKLNIKGKCLRADNIIPEWVPDKFLIECKNKKDPANVELVGKFYSLIKQSKIQLGLFISKNSITGKFNKDKKPERYWKEAMAFINKINLKYSESNNQIILLDLDLNDLNILIEEKSKSFIELIEDRKDQLEMDVNSSLKEWMKPHENSGLF
ncbi:restriction endonuclease [Clostridium baratii]|uniref:restriction endonuclease n=1 Tax=Clostridium baratii TaxID=1561 RepID=UPI002942741B|nr:restriction endonuclease [Clostridium baratii]